MKLELPCGMPRRGKDEKEQSTMKVWQLTAPRRLEEQERPENITEPSQVKVKISKVLLSDTELMTYCGKNNAVYPVVPGRNAVGVISEQCENGIGLEKGTRVYLHPVLPCKQCEACKTGNEALCSNRKIAGLTANGYLRDFAVTSLNNISVLPSSVSDTDALYTELIALAETTIDTLEISKGQHIVILGSGISGITLAQLMIYRQIVPIVIDDDAENLARAKRNGIYYTFLNDEHLMENISNITGGRMADAAVFVTSCRIEPSLTFRLTAPGTNVVFCGFSHHNLDVNLYEAIEKNLRIDSVTDGRGHISSAINLLANKAITFTGIEFEYHDMKDIPALYAKYAEELPFDRKKSVIINLL